MYEHNIFFISFYFRAVNYGGTGTIIGRSLAHAARPAGEYFYDLT